MFGFLKKQLKKGVEMLSRKIEEPEEVAPKAGKPEHIKPKKPEKPEFPESERPIEVREDEPLERTVGTAHEEIEEDVERGTPEIEGEPVEILGEEGIGTTKKRDIKKLMGVPEEHGKRGFFSRLRGRVTERMLEEKDIDEFFADSEIELLQSNVALEVSDFLKGELKEKLVKKPIKRSQAQGLITNAFEESIFDAVNQGSIDLEERIKAAKKEGRPLCIAFLGMNGGGKTTSIGKLAHYLTGKKHGVVLAAGDTFRAASIEQLEHHAKKLGVDIVKHKYGSDAAAVIFDAIQHAKGRGLDVVLADTAGRAHTNKNLMEELKKVVRVNKPDLKILVVDSLTGNDAVEQARQFNEAVGVDAVLMTKVDVNEKGGSILSVCYAIKKPILFIGTGQGYDDIKLFDPKEFVRGLME